MVEVEKTGTLQARAGKKDKVKGTLTFHVSFSSPQATENMKAKIDKEFKEAAAAGAAADSGNIPDDIKAMFPDEAKLKAALEAFHTATAGSCAKADAVRLPVALNKCAGLEPFIGVFSAFERSTKVDPTFLQEFAAVLFEFCDQDKDGVVHAMDFLRVYAAWHSENCMNRYNLFYNQFADQEGNLTFQQLSKLIQYANNAVLTRIAYYCRSTMTGLHPRAAEMTPMVQAYDWATFYDAKASKIFKKLKIEETGKLSKADLTSYFSDKLSRDLWIGGISPPMAEEKKLLAQAKKM
eukprot:TRINITY_DN1160_c0_g1_i1.p1 TRINITY_DN1160_c0_g1~~TRINITY_DN1160_c0_g1_i1.p1  ORF type:complete len:294 (+),score=97.45 TRINITY_DN1160_c0_g1_i1:845-1726(+)